MMIIAAEVRKKRKCHDIFLIAGETRAFMICFRGVSTTGRHARQSFSQRDFKDILIFIKTEFRHFFGAIYILLTIHFAQCYGQILPFCRLVTRLSDT